MSRTCGPPELKARHLEATVRELLGDERGAMWRDTILVEAPEVAWYATEAGRTIPVAVLEPL